MDVATQDARVGVFLRDVKRFDLIMRLLDHTSDRDVARLIGMTDRTVNRARAGDGVGGMFIAAVLIALAPHADALAVYDLGVAFEDVFFAGEKPAAVEAVAA